MIVFPLDCCILEEKKKNTTNVMFINITQRLIKKNKKSKFTASPHGEVRGLFPSVMFVV